MHFILKVQNQNVTELEYISLLLLLPYCIILVNTFANAFTFGGSPVNMFANAFTSGGSPVNTFANAFTKSVLL